MYEFSLMWFFIGILVTVAGFFFVLFYKEVADNMGSGVASYNRYKLIAVGTCIAGIIIMFNLHSLVIETIGRLVFGGIMRS